MIADAGTIGGFLAHEQMLATHGGKNFASTWLVDHDLSWAADLIPDLPNLDRQLFLEVELSTYSTISPSACRKRVFRPTGVG